MSDFERLRAIFAEQARRVGRRKIHTMYPDAGPLRRELYPKHMEFFRAGATYRERCFMAANRIGKALEHGTKVATPTGWVSIEQLEVGDLVISGSGSITRVVGVYPQGEVDLFELSFDGVNSVKTCGAHRWLYQHPRARYPYRQSHGKRETNPFYGEWVVGSTIDLARFGSTARTRAVVPMTNPFDLPARLLPLDPYVLGVLLGDGGLSRDSIKLTSADEEIVSSVAAHFELSEYDNYSYGVKGAMPVVRALGLNGTTSETKFIPTDYLYSDVGSRLAVLQGLMDTDGSISSGGCMEYSTCSDRLAEGAEWLATSLGIKVRKERRHTKDQNGKGKPSWRLLLRGGGMCPFRLSRKADRWALLKETRNWVLHEVRPAGRGLATCIEVADESHTFVTERGLVTHNSEGAGGYETALHLTGMYPHWWEGRRFDKPVRWWAAGKTNETTRDIVQGKLFGPIDYSDGTKTFEGTGLVLGDAIGRIAWKQGVQDLADTVRVKHASGGWSILGLKSYQQGRGSFEGTEQDGIWLDEEPPLDIYGECLIRTATTGGLIMMTYTPLEGMTDTVMQFLPDGMPDA